MEDKGFETYLTYPDIKSKIQDKIEGKTLEVLNKVGIEYENYIMKSLDNKKNKKFEFERQIEMILNKREKCFDNMMNTYQENTKKMYHDIKERHEILIKNIDNIHNDELYMPRSEVINVVETLFCEDFQNRITKIVDKKLNVTLNKISNESKIVSTNVSELITQVSNASQKVSDVFVKIDNLYDKCDEVTDIFLEKGKIHLQLIQKNKHIVMIKYSRIK